MNKYNFQIALPNGDVELHSIEGDCTHKQAEQTILKQYLHLTGLTRNGDNYTAAVGNGEEALPVPGMSPSDNDSGEPSKQPQPAKLPRYHPVESLVSNADDEALLLPVMNFDKKPQPARVTTRNAPVANADDEEALPLPVMNFEKKAA